MLRLKKDGKSFLSDLGINRNEVNYSNAEKFFYSGKVEEYGDLSTVFGTEEINASGLVLENGKVYPTTINTKEDLKKLNAKALFKQGYLYVKMANPDSDKALTVHRL